ncbi:hypothetical protein [Desulfosporosinus hippei]|uniref:Uncharacterized protein n=1 Tax=Desulfosporosinus hippei DSM 8344 TaxID=1121419 RepID=A0A1G8I497_9FIRM|nr:hypothetical protein [Desulfosporosinus hippei]SDI13785.1 hypothetical protein SAMN05443529_12739 [Desulfosporosinus hippei DSM 8344]
MHIGHNADDLDHESLAMRHLGEGILKERAGYLYEALNEYMVAGALDPDSEFIIEKLSELKRKMGL